MLLNTAGTPKKAILNGAPFDVMADSKPMIDLSGVTVEPTATSGDVVYVITDKPKTVKGLDCKMSLSEYNLLALAVGKLTRGISLPVGLTLADWTTVTGAGRINLGEYDAAAGKCSVDMFFDRDVVVAG